MGDRRVIIGCMSGTSLDGVDAAGVETRGRGLDASCRFLGGSSGPMGPSAGTLRGLASGEPVDARSIAEAASGLGHAHLGVIRGLAAQLAPIDLISVHGQTVVHRAGVNWQIMDVWAVAREFGVPVVHDLRGADIAAGGRGAPITPIADWMMFRDAHRSRTVVNLGGFCNITTLPPGGGPDEVRARDVCACNQVLDAVARCALGRDFDLNGESAMRGTARDAPVGDLVRMLRSQRDERRSLGTGDEAGAWVGDWNARCAPDDLAASACEAVGSVIGETLRGSDEVYLAGGGAGNRRLVRAIAASYAGQIAPLERLGVPGAFREAAAMAILGALCADGVAITLPRVTGVPAPAPLGGAWVFPGGPPR